MKKKSVVILIVSVIFLAGCGNTENNSETEKALDSSSLKENASFTIGAAVGAGNMRRDENFRELVKDTYDQISATSEMKMAGIWKGENTYDFENVDYLVDFAQENGMTVHGHTILWYRSFPDWFKEAKYDSATFETMVKTYIDTVVGRYKGRVRSWDVVNEAFKDDGTLRDDNDPVNEAFQDPIAFYGRCFQYVKDADPDVLLFFNDYEAVNMDEKRQAEIEMIQRFKDEGYPIDGIGDQFHMRIDQDTAQLKKGFAELVETGLLVHISELDIRMNMEKADDYIYTDEEKQRQANLYKTVVSMYSEVPEGQSFGITTWGVSDKYTWLDSWWHPKVYPLLFDTAFHKKPAYYGFLEGLRE